MTGELKVGGAVTFWKVGEFTSRSQLLSGLTRLGLNTMAPEPRTAPACLRDALEDTFRSREGYKVFPKKKRDCFEVVKVTYHETQDNEYLKLYEVSIDEERKISLSPYRQEEIDKLLMNFNRQLGLLRTAQVTSMLVEYVSKTLGGTTLRPSGGLYWLPAHKIDDLAQVAEVVQHAASHQGGNVIYFLRHQMDEDAMRAVRDAIVSEITSESERIHKDILSGDLGDRALSHRAHEAEELRQKITLYEELLDCGLQHLRDGLDKAEQGVAAAAVLGTGSMEA